MPFLKSSFVFGYVAPSSASVWINGSSVPVFHTGSFIAMIPFQPGQFKITAQAKLGGGSTESVRTVLISSPNYALPAEPLTISTELIHPSTDRVVAAGDIVPLLFKGSPNAKAEYRFKNLKNSKTGNEWKPIIEKPSGIGGIYEGSAVIHTEDEAEQALIEYRLTNTAGKSVKALSPGKIKIRDQTRFDLMEISAEETVLRTGPASGGDSMGYDLFLPKGVKLRTNGRIGNEIRIKLSETESGWTDEKNLKMLPESSPTYRSVLHTVKISTKEPSVLLGMELKEKVPFRAVVSNDLKLLTLTLFYTLSDIDRIRFEESSREKWLDKILWLQRQPETLDIQFHLKEKVWGYDLRYEGSRLVCEIIFPPPITSLDSPLNGLTIAVDPGHSPESGDGAVSPQGIKEGDINFKIASCLREKLEQAGAKVLMTRNENESLDLPARGRKAWQSKSDLFISVHTNAIPDGSNPSERRGFSVFYFQPHSFELAEQVHRAYKKTMPLSDDGFYYGNLAVCRVTQMPSILTESAYLILPEEEALLMTRDFQCLCSDAIVNGVTQFVRGFSAK